MDGGITHTSASGEAGFMLVEVLVAVVVLSIAVVGTFTMLDAASSASRRSLAHDSATALTREVLERARQLPYAQLAPPGAGARLRALLPDGAVAVDAGTFRVTRRDAVTLTVTVASCRVDAPADGTGVHDGSYCDRADALGDGSSGAGQAVGAALTLGGRALSASVGGTVTDQVCALLGTLPPGTDATLDALTGRNGGLSGLLAAGAGLRVCPSTTTGSVALDDAPDDLTKVVVRTTWAGGADERALLVANPDGA